MTPERAFTVIHNLDIPEKKRKFWPQWSTVIVSRDGVIEDVIQHFEWPNAALHRRQMEGYRCSMAFTAKAGEMYLTVEELCRKVQDCLEGIDHLRKLKRDR